MNEPVEIPSGALGSPDYLEEKPKGTGVKRINKRPFYLWIAIGLLIVSALGIAAYARGQSQQASNKAAAESYNVTTVASPPVKRPDGPDVSLPQPMFVDSGQGYAETPGTPAKEDESLKQARLKKIAALDAAMTSDSGVEKFNPQRNMAASRYPSTLPGTNGLIPPSPPPPVDQYGDEEGQGAGDINEQARKRAFLKAHEDEGYYLKRTTEPQMCQYQINSDSIIPGVMITGVNSDLPGQIIGQVRQNVYDSATGKALLIPAGAKLIGAYDSSVAAGQERVLIAWNRVIFPNGSALRLDSMPGADRSGFAGFNDKVDNHYLRTFGTAFMMSLFSAAAQLSQPRGAVTGTYNSQQIMAAALGQQLGMLGMQTIRRNLNIQPTLEIRPGYQFSILVTKHMCMEPWPGHPMQQNRTAQAEPGEPDVSGTYPQPY